MFGWKSKEKLKAELLEEIREEEETRRIQLEIARDKARDEERARLAAEQKAREEEVARLKASEEPWVEIKGIVQDPQRGIKIELDWNDAFVKHLRESGYKGRDDNTVIQRYVAVLAKQVALDFADDNSPEDFIYEQ